MEERVLLARQEWDDAFRALAGETASDIDPRVLEQMEAVTVELRRRIGASFTLAELADVYGVSEGWAHEAIAERSSGAGWVRTASAAIDAAFHLYARGARDYRP